MKLNPIRYVTNFTTKLEIAMPDIPKVAVAGIPIMKKREIWIKANKTLVLLFE